MARNEISRKERDAYPIRIGGAMVVSLLLAIAAIRWWPPPSSEASDTVYDARGQELIQIEEIQQTRQQASRPPPPRPLTPVIVPDDVILNEIEIELTDNLTLDPGEDLVEESEGADVPRTGGAAQPDRGPRAFRIVEPDFPREAERRNIRAEVVVEVLVNQQGRVESAEVAERFLVRGRDNERESVDLLGYGLEEAALSAARGWMFRPAREDGKIVASLTRVTISFGI